VTERPFLSIVVPAYWVLMADADLSMPWDNLARFLDVVGESDPPEIVAGSREAPSAATRCCAPMPSRHSRRT
jgi:hypothetical protein